LALKCKAVDFQLEAEDPGIVLACDAQKIQQVLLNLVLNAADAMDGRGTVRIRSFITAKDYVFVVEDSGPGVPGHLKEQIFTPFFTTKAAGKGTGIGLAFCLSTIEKHGGSLRLLPQNSQTGARFEIRLPIRHGDSV